MAKETKFGTFEELLAGKDDSLVEIATTLRNLIYEIHPESIEVVRLGDKAASFGVGPKKMSEAYAYVMPLKNRVNLGFYVGAILPDPENLLDGTGKKLRHIKVMSLEMVQNLAVRDLIVASILERKKALEL